MGGAQETIQSINNLQLENNKPTSLTLSIRGEAEKPSNNNEQISNLEVYNPNKGRSNNDRPLVLSSHQRIVASLASGAVAGAIAKSVIAPLDRTKIYFQTHPERRYRLKGAWKFIRLTYNQTGILSLWRGNSATMARIMPYAAIQFMSHDQYKTLLGLQSSPNETSSTQKREIEGCSTHALHFFAGLLAGVTAVSLTYPLDRARAVMAVTNVGEYKNLLHVFRRTFRDEGYRAMYRGFAPAIIGVVPYAGVSFATYETLKGMFLNNTGCKTAIDRNELDQLSDLSPLWRLLFGATAGLLGQFTSYPLDIVRRRMQTARQMGVNGNRYSSILGTLIYIYRKEGISRGWYKGISMNFIKGPIAVGTSFTINDYCKIAFSKLLLKTQSPRQDKA